MRHEINVQVARKPDVPRVSRRATLVAGLAATASLTGWPAWAQADHTTRIIVPFSPAGPADVMGRMVADEMRPNAKGPVIVENRPGAGTSIGAAVVARAAPDGSALLVATAAHVMNAPLLPLPYDPVNDFTAIGGFAYQPFVVTVLATDTVKDFAGFVEQARTKPGSFTLGTAGVGNASHLAGLLLEQYTGARFLYVPYGGSSQLQVAMLGGQVRGSFLNTTVAQPLIQAGRLRALAVTGKQRWRQLPDVPTVAELGFPDYECIAWYGFLGPKGMQKDQVDQLYRDIHAILHKDANRKIIADQGLDLYDEPPAAFAASQVREFRKWAKVIEAAGLNKKP
ncbi:tripartite tricarboxylate transporter substrate binding protein [Hydrogenophaga sp. SNF1]|uniref:Bug family tripartite tricarboxylate transporter substrate binding protein n=1 Tax=Hydrogenophaga sp. SNF1 TaxID=3098762 RepID=UPI002ACC3362|nr:tripartite tricarboxylate transporter substrate binding protein [Hydrogenophaga sp. SNF1]WQB84709.1 tripartite tricarboxylate transporter substrate binding protein [Hydrogenophaga sp. SNF1]